MLLSGEYVISAVPTENTTAQKVKIPVSLVPGVVIQAYPANMNIVPAFINNTDQYSPNKENIIKHMMGKIG